MGYFKKRKRAFWLKLVALIVVAVAAIALSVLARDNAFVQRTALQFGYLGVFVMAVLSGFNVAVPIPAIAFLPLFVAVGLSQWAVIAVIAVGMTAGDALGWALGRATRDVAGARWKLPRSLRSLERFLMQYRYGSYIFLFIYAAFVPLPNELVVIPYSFLRMKFRHVITVVLIGNIVFNTLAGLGLLGIVRVF